ncbi:hypothetical protein HNY73_015502 [Argiope bruennichi]|uniref:Uncharacterized protein n=1 Tax=Argiope bruennichi TaxID=94029 RepID=A0A8T0EX04_ARGBR|nr:hypothetical protein HNY73_015502 [Argiope bruennichi]
MYEFGNTQNYKISFAKWKCIPESKALVNSSWKLPPSRPWYLGSGPGGALSFGGARQDQTALSNLNLATSRLFGSPVGTRSSPSAQSAIQARPLLSICFRCIGFSRENLLHSPIMS